MKLVENKKVLVEDVKGTSQYDGQQVLRDVHSLPGHYLRTRDAFSLVTSHFDSFLVEYDVNENPINIQYIVGIEPHLTTIGVLSDVEGSLIDTGFLISSSRREKIYAVYYTVSGIGTPPELEGVINLEIPLETNDSAQIVALATKAALDSTKEFDTEVFNSVLEISTKKLGETNNTISFGGSPFLIQNESGLNEVVGDISIKYSETGSPIWQGQELKGHKYNIYTAKFETMLEASTTQVEQKKALDVLSVDAVIWDEINTTFPDTVTDLFTYSYNGSPVQTVKITYQDTAKSIILNVVKTRL